MKEIFMWFRNLNDFDGDLVCEEVRTIKDIQENAVRSVGFHAILGSFNSEYPIRSKPKLFVCKRRCVYLLYRSTLPVSSIFPIIHLFDIWNCS